MRHFVLTRAVYHPEHWTLEENQRRLRLFTGITVRGMKAQSHRDWTWVLAVSPHDQLLDERTLMAQSVGVPVLTVPVTKVGVPPPHLEEYVGKKRGLDAIAGYQADWNSVIWSALVPRLTTRIDDDDCFAPDALARIQRAVRGRERHAIIIPRGYRVWGRRYALVEHRSNAMSSFVSPAGDGAHCYTFLHREIANHVPVVYTDRNPGWLWVRHPDTLSGHRAADKPITAHFRSRFPIDWQLLDSQPLAEPEQGEVYFR